LGDANPTPYNGTLTSYGGPGSTEYVDTLAGQHDDQKYTIPGALVYSVGLSDGDEKTSSSNNYVWQSNAA